MPSSSKGITRSASAINVRSSSDAQLFDFLNSESGGNDVANKASFPLTSTPIRSKAASRVAPSATIVPKPFVLEKAVTSAENSNAPGIDSYKNAFINVLLESIVCGLLI